MTPRPSVKNSPGLIWRPRKSGWEARWQARTDLSRRGYEPKSVALWVGANPDPATTIAIRQRCNELQQKMHAWAKDNPSPAKPRRESKHLQWIKAHMAFGGDECLPWPFAKDSGVGRGCLYYEGKTWWAHRLMCTLVHGNPPTPKHQAAHLCGKGHEACMNPRHLAWQTQSENHRDRRKHGTAITTHTGPVSKLTSSQIAEIRALKGRMTQMAVARKFGISHANVRYWQGERDKLRTSTPRTADMSVK